MNRLVMLIAVLTLGLATPPAWAQQSSSALPTVYDFSGYEPMSLKALLNLYWKVGLLKIDDEKAVTEYLQVADCKLYHDRFEDDFAWPKTLEATRNYIKTYGPHFPSQVMTMQQIGLGRYLPDKKIFQISDDTQYKSVERVFFADYTTGRPPCEGSGFPTSAPLRAVMDIGDPFSMIDIPIPSDDFARKIIHEIDDRMKMADINFDARKRFAYVRFYYTVRAFKKVSQADNVVNNLQGPALEFVGTLDGYAISADYDGVYPIYQWINPKGQMGKKPAPEDVLNAPVPAGSGSSH